MTQKRYAIVRVCTDNGIYRCPTNNGKCLYPKGVEVYCKKCAEINGDTKEQLIRKVAQPLFQREIEIWYEHFPDENPDKEITKTLYKNCIEQATKILEFLGVE